MKMNKSMTNNRATLYACKNVLNKNKGIRLNRWKKERIRNIMISSIIGIVAGFSSLSSITYSSYHAMSCNTNRSLEGENAHTMQSVASISKVMTAIIAIEHASLEDFVVIGDDVMYAEGSSIYLQPGQIVSIRSLLYGLLLRSGNDAALAIAQYVGGNDVDRFVSYMNEKAELLGMKNTIFSNPSGLDEDGVGNQSTPYDMTILMCASLTYPQLKEIMSTKTYKTEYSQVWSNKNRLLSLYPYTVGGKTGFTKRAGRTLISGADNGFPIAIATFRYGNDFSFHRDVYQRLYETYQNAVLVKSGVYYYKNRKYQVEQNLSIIVKDFKPENVSIQYDKKSLELIVSYTDGSFHQEYRIQGRKIKHE